MPVRSNAPKSKPRMGASRPHISRPSMTRRPSGGGRGLHTGFSFSFGNRRQPGQQRTGCIGCLIPMALAVLAVAGVLVAVL